MDEAYLIIRGLRTLDKIKTTRENTKQVINFLKTKRLKKSLTS